MKIHPLGLLIAILLYCSGHWVWGTIALLFAEQ
jgi:hypothetical protein